MYEELNSVLSTSTEANDIGQFDRYRYIVKPQYRPDMSTRPIISTDDACSQRTLRATCPWNYMR